MPVRLVREVIPCVQIWQPQPGLRISSAAIGIGGGVGAATLVGVAVFNGQWLGAALALAAGALLVGPALAVAFYVRLAFDGQRLIYRSANPAVIKKTDVAAVQVTRLGTLNTMGIPFLRIVDPQGRVLLSATCAWSQQQVAEIARTLEVPFERT
jgi:hypothetical protein